MSRPDGERYLCPLQSFVVSLLLLLISTLLFFRTGGVLSHRNSSTHRVPRFPLRNLSSLVMLAVPSLVFSATNTTYCNALIFLELAESRILLAAPADTRPRNLSFHSALSSYGLFTPLALWRLSVSLQFLVQPLGG